MHKTIAKRMVWAREMKKLTQEGLAKAAGVAQSTIAGLESGYRKSPRRLPQIAAALGVDPIWLAEGCGNPEGNVNDVNAQVVHMPDRLSPTLESLLNIAKGLSKDAQRELLGMAKGLAATEKQAKANRAR